MTVAVCMWGVWPDAAAAAKSHRARLSRDLAERLSKKSTEVGDVIVDGSRLQVQRLAERYNLRIKRQLSGGAVLEVTGGQLDALSLDTDVSHISSDAPVRSTMAVAIEAIGADTIWRYGRGNRADGYTGRGIGVAIIDSGIAHHPAVRQRVVVDVDFSGAGGDVRDEYGHGTHVAGIVAGDGPGVTEADRFSGVAPDAHLINLRVIGPDGSGRTSAVIDAIDWAIANRERYDIRVLNLSLGHPVFESYRDDPLAQAAERAVAAGLIVVASAGNYGRTADGAEVFGGIVSPGHAPNVLTVGAVDGNGTARRSDDVVAGYSSRGPTLFDGLIKPDLVAPGSRIVSLEAEGSYLSGHYPERVTDAPGVHDFFRLSGTSMAAGVVSGAVALLLEANPELTPAEVKFLLQYTSSSPTHVGLLVQGAGELNIAAATSWIDLRLAPPIVRIADETVASSRRVFFANTTRLTSLGPPADPPSPSVSIFRHHSILWTEFDAAGNAILWTNASETPALLSSAILWTNAILCTNAILWTNAALWTHDVTAHAILWTNSILWTNAILWTNSTLSLDAILRPTLPSTNTHLNE